MQNTPPEDQCTPISLGDNPCFEAIQISKKDVLKALQSFSLSSIGAADGLTPQHIRDLITRSASESLQQAVVDFVNLVLAGAFDKEANGGSLWRKSNCILKEGWQYKTNHCGLYIKKIGG